MKGPAELTFLQLNDSHAYFEPHFELFWSGSEAQYRKAGGYARIASIVKEVRHAKRGQVIFCDCGDTMHGTYPAVASRGQAMVPVLNGLDLDAMAAHWEFAYGPDQFKSLAQQLNFPVLGLNVHEKEGGTPVFPPYSVVERAGARVAIIGINSNIVDKTMPPSFSEGIRFTLGTAELPEAIARARGEDKAELVVAISHLGFPQDYKLASEIGGVDILLSGHTHNRLYRPAVVGRTVIIQSGCHGSFLGRLDVQVEGGRVVDFQHALIEVSDVPDDPEIGAIVDEVVSPHRERLSAIAGETATALNRNTVLEATTDNLLLQALKAATDCELAFSNGWRYGAPVPPGPVTVNDLYNIIPVDPPVSTVDLSGAEVRSMLEENLEHTFASDPYKQMGGYLKRFLGLTLYFKVENPFGQRVQEIFVGSAPLDDKRTYSAAFVTSQGVPAKYGTNRRETSVSAVEALRRYLAANSPVNAELRGAAVAV